MTRLRGEDVSTIPWRLEELDRALVERTGMDLLSLAARAARTPPAEARRRAGALRAAVVPVATGEGIIPGFVEAVCSVLLHLGFDAWVTEEPDVGGFGEAVGGGADLLLSADDTRFLALDLRSRRVVDNAWATARGFVQALAAAAEHRGRHLAAQEALVLGLGPVGMHAVRALCEEGARVCVHDLDARRLARCAAEEHVRVARCLREALSTIDYVLDATPSAAIIDAPELRPGTIVSSPGVPHGLTPAALSRLGTAFIHDELALGVAVMAVAGSQGGDPSRKPCSRAPAAGLRTG